MAKFIKVTILGTDQVIRLNIDNIIYYVGDENGDTKITHISNGDIILVKETLVQVDDLIKNAW